jgi:hypothetical protein
MSIGLRSGQFPIACVAPEVCAAGAEKSSSETAKRQNELAGIVALKGAAGKFEKKSLELLLRMRLPCGSGISVAGSQSAPSALV